MINYIKITELTSFIHILSEYWVTGLILVSVLGQYVEEKNSTVWLGSNMPRWLLPGKHANLAQSFNFYVKQRELEDWDISSMVFECKVTPFLVEIHPDLINLIR